MSTPSDNNPGSSESDTASVADVSPFADASPGDALVATGRPVPQVWETTQALRPERPEILRAAPKPSDLLRALQRRWLLALVLALVFAIPAAIIAWFTVPVTFAAETWLRIKNDRLVFRVRGGESSINTHVQLIKSYFVISSALSRPGVSDLEWIKEVEDKGNDPADWLSSRVAVSAPGRYAEIMRISMGGEDPKQLQSLVQAVTDAYLERVVNTERKEMLKRRDLLEQTYYAKTEEVRKKREDIHVLARQIGTADSEVANAQQKLLLDHVLDLRQQVSDFRNSKLAKQRAVRVFEERNGWNDNSNRIPPEMRQERIASDYALRQMNQRLVKTKEELQELLGIVKNPKTSKNVRKSREAIAQVQQEMNRRIEELSAEIQGEIDRGEFKTPLQAEHERLTTELAELERVHKELEEQFLLRSQDVKKLGAFSADLTRRREELSNLLSVTNSVGYELEKLQLEVSGGFERVQLIQKARLPRTANTGRRDKMTMVAGFAGLALAIGGTSLFEFHHRRISSGEEMVTGLGIRVMGNVPMLSERRWRFARGQATNPEDLQGIMDESVDGIRAMLLHSEAGESIRTLLITSAKAGEGKTTIATALAASMGRSGRRTLLIDGDLRRPTVHRLLDVPIETGFAEVLRGEASEEDVIRPSRAAGLWFMSAGQCDHVSLQALTKEGVGEIFEKLRAEFDFVIVDSGPALAVVDPLLLGQHCDGAVISVVRRVSQIPAIYETCDRLRSTGIKIVGCVINGLQGSPFTPGYYAYSYGYGYGNGQTNGQEAPAETAET